MFHLNQRGLATILRKIIPFLSRNQRQLPHKKQALGQRSNRDKVTSGGEVAVQKMVSASRRMSDLHKDCHRVSHKDSHQSHQRHLPVDPNCVQSSWHRRYPLATFWRPTYEGQWCSCKPWFSWQSRLWVNYHPVPPSPPPPVQCSHLLAFRFTAWTTTLSLPPWPVTAAPCQRPFPENCGKTGEPGVAVIGGNCHKYHF